MSALTRRQFVWGARVAGLGLLAGCGRLPGQAQPRGRVPRLGVLINSGTPGTLGWLDGFRQGMQAQGYVESQNVVFEVRAAEGNEAQLPALAAELVGLPADLIVAGGVPAIRAAQQATQTIPIVMVGPVDPVGNGLVASLARPGGNVTGLSILGGQLAAKRLDLLKETVPDLLRVATLRAPPAPSSATVSSQVQEVQSAADALGLQLRFLELRSGEDIEPAFEIAATERSEGLLILTSAVAVAYLRRIAEMASARRLPAIFDRREFAVGGGLLAYGPNLPRQLRYAATYVDKLLKGASPGDLPVEQPREFDFVINLKTAQALGLTIAPHVLLQATEVLQ
jgi:putative tryptophan/tyrosine transport system substrate-binding protein